MYNSHQNLTNMAPDSDTRPSLIYPSMSVNSHTTSATFHLPSGPEGGNVDEVEAANTHQILLSVAVLPVIVALLGNKTVTQWLQDWGDQTEEVFRSERLPILPFPEKN
jgi:hypothetical protein